MRSILISVLLIVTAIIMYVSVAEGDKGMKNQVNRSGDAMGHYIKGMSP